MADLSVCVIVKNDPERLRRAIDSVRALDAPVLVTDTGSTDNTCDVARAAGADLDTLDWRDDFAAAYNHAIDRADTEWVLSLDADEWLAPESPRRILHAIQRDDAMGYNLLRRDLRDATDPSNYSEMWQLRLFRKRGATRYVGRIHHQFQPPLEDIARAERRRVLDSDIVMLHDGYVARDWAAKLRRDIELMELELADRPAQFYYHVEIGLAAWRLKDGRWRQHLHAAALTATNDAIRPGLPRAAFTRLLEWTVAHPALPADFPISAERAERWITDAFASEPPLLWQLARRAFERNDHVGAAQLLERLIALGESGDYPRLTPFDPRILGDDTRLNLAACYVRLARLDDAERILTELLRSERCRDAAQQNLAQIRALRAAP